MPGDILLFRWRAHLPAKHMAIVSAPDLMIHAHDGGWLTRSRFRGSNDYLILK